MRLHLATLGFIAGLTLLPLDAAHADRPSFLDQSLDKTIIYGPHGTSRTVREAPGTGTSYVYPEDHEQRRDRYECDHQDKCYPSDDNESDPDDE